MRFDINRIDYCSYTAVAGIKNDSSGSNVRHDARVAT